MLRDVHLFVITSTWDATLKTNWAGLMECFTLPQLDWKIFLPFHQLGGLFGCLLSFKLLSKFCVLRKITFSTCINIDFFSNNIDYFDRCGSETWPRQKWTSSIPKHQVVDRCPSPMPPRRQVDDLRKTNEVKRRSKYTPPGRIGDSTLIHSKGRGIQIHIYNMLR